MHGRVPLKSTEMNVLRDLELRKQFRIFVSEIIKTQTAMKNILSRGKNRVTRLTAEQRKEICARITSLYRALPDRSTISLVMEDGRVLTRMVKTGDGDALVNWNSSVLNLTEKLMNSETPRSFAIKGAIGNAAEAYGSEFKKAMDDCFGTLRSLNIKADAYMKSLIDVYTSSTGTKYLPVSVDVEGWGVKGVRIMKGGKSKGKVMCSTLVRDGRCSLSPAENFLADTLATESKIRLCRAMEKSVKEKFGKDGNNSYLCTRKH